MLLRITCPHCATTMELDAERAHADVTCSACRNVFPPPPVLVGPGTTIGNFRIERQLGGGAMGEVFLAIQLSMDRRVALKVLPQALTRDPRTVERFRREVRMSARLEHPNIVTAFEAGEDAGYHFLAMTYVEGEDLGTRLKREGALEERAALLAGRQIADALRYAWDEHQLLHRDVKPSNIMVDDNGRARLMDLGISICLNEAQASLTTAGMIIGTPHYMSPEQIRGEDLDWRADAYSLGATLYHLVTGGPPFRSGSSAEVIGQHLAEPVIPARKRRGSLTAGCSLLLERMMAKNRDDRHRSWEDLLRDFDLVLAGKLPPLPPHRSDAAAKPSPTKTSANPVVSLPPAPPPKTEERLPPVIDFKIRRTRPGWRRLETIAVFLILAGGLAFALWQLWLQFHTIQSPPAPVPDPDAVPAVAEITAEPAELRDVLDTIATALVEKRPAEANEALRKALQDPALDTRLRPALRRVELLLSQLHNYGKLLRESFEADVGKPVVLDLRDGPVNVILDQVDAAALRVTYPGRGGKPQRHGEIDYRDLTVRERIKRFDSLVTKRPSLHLLLGLLRTETGDYAGARQDFAAAPYVLQPALLRALDHVLVERAPVPAAPKP